MPFTVKQLIGNDRELVKVYDIDPVTKAQELMIKNKFSQLPVIDKQDRALGLITSDSILRAQNIFGTSATLLRVVDAMEEVKRTYREDDDLFFLLDELKETYAALIVDSEHKLIGIITSYDTTEYFRQRAEDLMYAEDIETMLKDYINAYFTDENGEIDDIARNTAIAEIMSSNSDLFNPFRGALTAYLEFQGDEQPKINQDLAKQAFTKHLYRKAPTKAFEQLVQSQYIDLFLHANRWSRYEPIFSFDRKKIRTLLEDAKNTRNDNAHFRSEEITQEQRERLKICRDWLARHRSAVEEAFGLVSASQRKTQPVTDIEITNNQSTDTIQATTTVNFLDKLVIDSSIEADSVPTESPAEEVSSRDSRYAPLALWLQERPLNQERVLLSFNQIEEIIGDELPISARQNPSWWSNDSVGHVQSQQWLEVGWKKLSVDLKEEKVIFARSKTRDQQYINFFTELLSELTVTNQFPLNAPPLNGRNWVTIAPLPGPTFLGFAFTRRERFRVALYIDTGSKEKNKHIFDVLRIRKVEIEAAFENISGTLEWERINDKQPSRIALYHQGAITDKPDQLMTLRRWAVAAMIRFQAVMQHQLNEVVQENTNNAHSVE